MTLPTNPPIDRFLIAAIADRLIYHSEIVFNPDDARTLLHSLPRRKTSRFELGIAGRFRGGSSRGYAAGVGSVKVEDKKDRDFAYSTSQDAYVRAGQWKLLWSGTRNGQAVEIEQVMADPTDEGRGARVLYDVQGEPLSMDIRSVRALKFFFLTLIFPGWKPWKTPET